MKPKLLIAFTLLFFFGTLSAQQRGPRFSKEEIVNQKWTTISEKLKASAEELAKIEPIFRETEDELWDLLAKNRETFRNSRRANAPGSANFEAINEAMVNFEVENAAIHKRYYLKLKKAVSAEVINQLLRAEKDYQRELMQRNVGQPRDPRQPGETRGQREPRRPNGGI
jgi:Spy/CpxP family protein refolding chaperone